MANISNIIFFIENPFSQRDYERFGIEIFRQDGYDVQVWDFSPCLKPTVYKFVKPPDSFVCNKLILIHRVNDADLKLSEMAGTVFAVNFLNYNFLSLSVFRSLTRHRVPYAVYFGDGLFSSIPKKKWRVLLRVKRIKNQSIKDIVTYYINMLLKKIPCWFWGVSPAAFVIVRGAKCIINKSTVGKTTETVYTHAMDYDIYLKEKHQPIERKNFVVFLDEYMPYHPDYVHFKMKPPVTPEEYYLSLRHFFDFLEKELYTNIVVAAHPRSKYSPEDPVFGGRTIYRGITSDLVRRSKFVLLHCSTAINFAALYRKPMLFITTDQLEGTKYRLFIQNLAAYFGQHPVNINNFESFHDIGEFEVHPQTYDQFIFDYIKAGGPKLLPSWKIMSNRIRELDAMGSILQ